MGFLDKMKNLFTEEIEEEEIKPQKREVKPVEQSVTRRENTMQREFKTPLTESKIEENKEKFVFPVYFDDKDFDDLEKPKPKPKPTVPKEEKKEEIKREPYQGAKVTIAPEPKKVFKPSPIISPVYGVLDKNYSKDDITTKQEKNKNIVRTPVKPENMTIDDIRKKAYGTLEDDLEDTLAYDFSELEIKPKHSSSNKEALDIFNELDFDEIEEIKENKFEELEKNIILERQEKIIDDDTAELARQLEEQKKKLEEISKYINKNEVVMESVDEKEETVDEFEESIELEKTEELEDTIEIEISEETEKTDEQNLNDSELFDLIDSMYETKEDDE